MLSILNKKCRFLTKISIFNQKFVFWFLDKNVDFDPKCLFWPKMSILAKNVDFGQECRFWPKMSILTKNFYFWPKNSIFDEKFLFLTKIQMFYQIFFFSILEQKCRVKRLEFQPKFRSSTKQGIRFLSTTFIFNQNFDFRLNVLKFSKKLNIFYFGWILSCNF